MPSRRQAAKPGKVKVPEAESMLALTFRLHCQLRHPRLGFWNRGEHAADHRLHPDQMDHEHEAITDDTTREPESGQSMDQ